MPTVWPTDLPDFRTYLGNNSISLLTLLSRTLLTLWVDAEKEAYDALKNYFKGKTGLHQIVFNQENSELNVSQPKNSEDEGPSKLVKLV